MSDKRRVTWHISSASLADGTEPDALGVVDELPTEHTGRYEPAAGPNELGRGGLGRVLLVDDRHLGREVARKELLSDNPGAGASQRFLREARVTAALEHPNVVPVYDIGSAADGRLFYTMKRIRGRTLRDVLEESKTIEDRLALLPRFVDACNAVAFAHSLGVVHRDLKPENVMVGEFGETLVVDWGLAKVRGEKEPGELTLEGMAAPGRKIAFESGNWLQTQYGATIGTPAYMSPEQARGELDKIDERSDVWSLGVMLHEILTGHTPFEGESVESVVAKVRLGELPPIGQVTGAPPALCAIVDKAVQGERTDRYADAKALAKDVEAFLAGQRVAVYEYSFAEEVARWVRAHRELVGTATVGVLACAALSAYAFQHVSAQRDRAVAAEQALSVKEKATREELAAALAERASLRMGLLDAASARALAARALQLGENPVARGALLSAQSMHAPKLLWSEPLELSCDMLKVSPDGRWLACPSTTVVHLWDLKNGRTHKALGHGDMYGWGFSWAPDSRSFLLGGDNIVRWIDVETGAIDRMLDTGTIAMSTVTLPTGDTVVGGDDGRVRVYDRLGRLLRELTGHRDAWVVSVALSPDGSQLASISQGKQIVRWDTKSWTVQPALDDSGRGGSALQYGDGGHLVSCDWIGDDDRVYLWDLATGHATPVRGSLAEVSAVAAAPNVPYVASGASDGSVNVWNWDGTARFRLPDAQGAYTMVGLSDDGATLYTSDAKTLRAWGLPPFDGFLRGHRREVTGLVVEEGGRTAVTIADDGDVARWDLTTGQRTAVATINPDGLWGLAESGGIVVVGSRYGNLYGLDAATFEVKWTVEEIGVGANDLKLSRDGTSVVIADDSGVMRVSVADGTELARLSATTVEYAGFDFVGETVVAAANYAGRLLVLDPETLAVKQVLHAPASGLASMAASPDGAYVATASDDGRVHVWAWADRRVTHTLPYSDEPAETLTFSPDGKLLAAGGGNGHVVLWSVPDFAEVADIPAHGTRIVRKVLFDGPDAIWTTGGDAVARRIDIGGLQVTAEDAAAAARDELGVTVVDGRVVGVGETP